MVVIHCEPRIPWQGPFADKMLEGLSRIGIEAEVSDSRQRQADVAILLGTSMWRGIEADGGDWLLVDRCSFRDTNQWVSLVWNGHGRRGDHRAPERYSAERWARIGVPLGEWGPRGSERILCGQTETYSPHWSSLAAWYRSHHSATHFRSHPAGDNPTGLPETRTWDRCGLAITLNSSIAVDTIMAGIPTVVDDEGGMAFGVDHENRTEWCHWLAWTQWNHAEIKEGEPIRHLFDSAA